MLLIAVFSQHLVLFYFHYLVKLLHFIHKSIDSREPHAVLLTLVDLEKAFNRVSHQLVIEDLADMGVPGWLLAILVSYLSGRSMVMRFRGATSSRRGCNVNTVRPAACIKLSKCVAYLRPSL